MKSGFVLLVIALLALTGCGAGSGGSSSGGASDNDRQVAEFRYWAREAYRAIMMEACGPRPLYNHARALAPQIAAVRAFEAEMGTTPAAAQLAIARSDEAYRRAAHPQHCRRDYGEARSVGADQAKAREQAVGALRELRSRASTLPVRGGPVTGDPANAPEFRATARELADLMAPMCPATGGDDSVLALAEVERLHARLAPTPYAAQFAIAESDVRYLQSITQVECGEPSAESNLLTDVKARVARSLVLAGL